ncbi:MAG: Rrf2 family transcriptional regulator [Chloroflexota bacterium]
MLRINRQTDYAVRVVLALAQHPAETRLSSAEIGREMLIPPTFLPRIVAQLAQAGIIITYPGRDGGLKLSRPPENITLWEVVNAFEGPLMLSECLLSQQACPFESNCMVRPRWGRLQAVILKELSTTTFRDLAEEAAAQQPLIINPEA